MGLCKCPKKKVTNQFCFEHKVNVCEHCMTTGVHQTCIVGPYLQWLENSNFESSCYLCKNHLTQMPCIRLCCYHVFHLNCLDNYANQLPANTAPAGYVCPVCTMPIFSLNSDSSKSPVASLLEKSLANFPWAREGIGLGLLDSSISKTNKSTEAIQLNGSVAASDSQSLVSSVNSNESTKISMPTSNILTANSTNYNSGPKILHSLHNKSNYSSPISVSNVTSFISTNSDLSFGSTSSMRSKFDNESRRSLLASDIVEDKYRTKSPIEFLSRWLRSRSSYMRNQRHMAGIGLYKKFIMIAIIAFLLLFVLVYYFFKFGRQVAENDPMLDPRNDPNFRNQF